MRLGIFGGSFNPIHLGHMHIAREFARQLSLDEVLFIPTSTPPHKRAPELAPAEERLAMCRLALQGEPAMEASDLELRRGGKSYTADTLRQLAAERPGDGLFLLMGEDMFLTLQNWYHPQEICRLAAICAAPRSPGGRPGTEGQKALLEGLGARVSLCSISFLPISSTLVRQAVKDGASLAGLVPPQVEAYIREKGLYAKR